VNDPVTAVVLCAGDATRYGGAMKQLLEVDGEPLLGRTLRQMEACDIPTRVVTHKPGVFETAGIQARFFCPVRRRWTVETLLSTRSLWGRRQTIVLLGDVYYSDRMIQLLAKCETLFYCGYEEIWGLSIDISRYEKVERVLKETIREAERRMAIDKGREHHQGQLWRFYRVWYGLPYIGEWTPTPGLLFQKCGTTVVCMDETSDFDVPAEYEAWCRGLRGWQTKFPKQERPCLGLAPVDWIEHGDSWRCPYDRKIRRGFKDCKTRHCVNRHEPDGA
jgi:hypothetical protein